MYLAKITAHKKMLAYFTWFKNSIYVLGVKKLKEPHVAIRASSDVYTRRNRATSIWDALPLSTYSIIAKRIIKTKERE
jgi:hypothetical protein